jgi:hypothetical protein
LPRSRHQGRGHRALRAHRHQRDGTGAEAGGRQPGRDAGRGLGLRRGHAAQGRWSSAATRARSTRPMPRPRRDLMRIGGKDVEGAYVVSGPAVVAEQLPGQPPVQEGGDRLRHQVREGLWRRLAQPVRRPRLRRLDGAGEGGAGGAEEGQAGHPGVPRRAEGRHRGHGPHGLRARRDELDQGRPLGLHDRDRRDAEGRQRRRQVRGRGQWRAPTAPPILRARTTGPGGIVGGMDSNHTEPWTSRSPASWRWTA